MTTAAEVRIRVVKVDCPVARLSAVTLLTYHLTWLTGRKAEDETVDDQP